MTGPAPSPAPKLPVSLAANPVLSSWVRFSPEGHVTISTFPGEIVTCPSGENRTQDDRTGFAARLTGNFGAGEGAGPVIGLPSRPPRAAQPVPFDYANRSGTNYGPARP